MFATYYLLMNQSKLLKTIPLEELKEYLHQGDLQIKEYPPKSTLHLEGEKCTSLEVILSGRIVVERIDETGHLFTIVDFYSHDVIGGNLLFSKYPYYPMTISTQCPSILLEIEKERVFALCQTNSLFLRNFLENLSDNTALLGHTIKNYLKRSIREMVLHFLRVEEKKQQSKTIRLPMSKKMLAERIGIQRTSLSRELKKMKEDGWILYDAKTITILKDI